MTKTITETLTQDSGIDEYYTDPRIIDAARRVMGSIELDPFSSPRANEAIKAERIFTKADDGFVQVWDCETLWMNHPFSRDNNPRAVAKITAGFALSTIRRSACMICFAATSERWFQPLTNYAQCYLAPRTNYFLPDGTKKRGVLKGSVVTYFGDNLAEFANAFRHLGHVRGPRL